MKRPSAPVIISSAALFFSLTGAGLAASPYVITNTHQIKPNVLRYLHGKRGPQGASGANGIAGPAGATGAPGVFSASDLSIVDGPITTLCAYGGPSTCVVGSSLATCPAGTTVVSGGYNTSLINGAVANNQPLGTTTWEVIGVNNTTLAVETVQAVAVCAS